MEKPEEAAAPDKNIIINRCWRRGHPEPPSGATGSTRRSHIWMGADARAVFVPEAVSALRAGRRPIDAVFFQDGGRLTGRDRADGAVRHLSVTSH